MLLEFIIFSLLNVVIQTAKNILTIKGNRYIASVANAVAFGLYTYILVLINGELPLHLKIIVTATVNLIGVFVVKTIEDKARKDKLYKIEVTLEGSYANAVATFATQRELNFNYFNTTEGDVVFNFFAKTKKETLLAKEIINAFDGKYFVSETKII